MTTTKPETQTATVAETLVSPDRSARYDATAIEEKWRARWARGRSLPRRRRRSR